MEQHIDELIQLQPSALQYCIQRCCELKALTVAKDETEQGERALLNLGHTFGHAIETHLGYGKWLHGEAVAAGMMMAAYLSHHLDDLSVGDISRLQHLLQQVDLPVHSPDEMTADDYLPHMMRDKKVLAGKLRLILLKSLGSAYVTSDVDKALVLQSIQDCIKPH